MAFSLHLDHFKDQPGLPVAEHEKVCAWAKRVATELAHADEAMADIDEDALCAICYASANGATFAPCGVRRPGLGPVTLELSSHRQGASGRAIPKTAFLLSHVYLTTLAKLEQVLLLQRYYSEVFSVCAARISWCLGPVFHDIYRRPASTT